MKTTITCGTLIKMVKNYNVSLSGVSIEKENASADLGRRELVVPHLT